MSGITYFAPEGTRAEMMTGLYNSAAAMEAASLRQEVLSRNLAHATITGYKRTNVSFDRFASDETAGAPTNVPPLTTTRTQTDFSQGAMKRTGRALDLAISGSGFFQVQGPDGPLLTRNGVFNRTDSGTLVTSSGYELVDSPVLPTDVATSDITIAASGMLSVAGRRLGNIKIVTVADPTRLTPSGPTLFKPPEGAVMEAADGAIEQGAREQANVTSVIEMVQMLAGMRHHEANTKAIRMITDAVQRHIASGDR